MRERETGERPMRSEKPERYAGRGEEGGHGSRTRVDADVEEEEPCGVSVSGEQRDGRRKSKRETHPTKPTKLPVPTRLRDIPSPARLSLSSPPSPPVVPLPRALCPPTAPTPTPPPTPPTPARPRAEPESRAEPVDTAIAPSHTRVERGEERVGVEHGEGRSKRKFIHPRPPRGRRVGRKSEWRGKWRGERAGTGGGGGRAGNVGRETEGRSVHLTGIEGAEDGVLDGRKTWDWGCETWSGDGEGVGRAQMGGGDPNNNHKREGKTHSKHHKTNHVEDAEDRAAGERVNEHCVVIVERRGKGGRDTTNEWRGRTTHVTSPVWIVGGGTERQNRRKIDRRAIVSLKRQEAGDARQMDVREIRTSRRRVQPLPRRSQKTPRVSQHGDNSFALLSRGFWSHMDLVIRIRNIELHHGVVIHIQMRDRRARHRIDRVDKTDKARTVQTVQWAFAMWIRPAEFIRILSSYVTTALVTFGALDVGNVVHITNHPMRINRDPWVDK
ncbi:hypothetical protein B0H13DRAFT_1891832 [Mycena leptocephala]|nr:hypothetical protein B0H13DRAFT_1891832 [Mycena leptocephala]